MLSNREPTPPQSLGVSRRSGQPSSQTHAVSTEPSSTRTLSDSGIFNGGFLLSIAYNMYTAHADSRSMLPTSPVPLEDSRSEVAERHTDEVAEVTHPGISPSSFDHTPVLGGRVWESTTRAGRCRQTPFVEPSPWCSHNTIWT